MSPMTRLLLDRTLGILAGMKEPFVAQSFVAVMPQLVGSQIKAWVMLSHAEFLDMFGLPEGGARLQ
jgi:hypothetical protein